jgi:phospholipase/carboxylesterase
VPGWAFDPFFELLTPGGDHGIAGAPILLAWRKEIMHDGMWTRRAILRLAVAAGATAGWPRTTRAQQAGTGRLAARPGKPERRWPPGEQALGFAAERDGFVYVPANAAADKPAPLAVLLHGATMRAAFARRFKPLADEFGVILLSIDSRSITWDAIQGQLGPDVAFLDRALQHTFAHCAIDAKRIAIGGFSDGASYGLTLGLANGDLFTHVLAFSPGFMVPPSRAGRPRIFISHGTQDRILPIAQTSQRIVPGLKRDGYTVRYEEFDGPHTVPPEIARAGMKWVTE